MAFPGRVWKVLRHRRYAFSVMSYNVLADDLLWNNAYLYADSPVHTLQWKNRSILLIQEILRYSPDVVCLQEVQANHFVEFFLPHMDRAGYTGFFTQRRQKSDGCASFFSRKKFTLTDVNATIDLSYHFGSEAHLNFGNVAQLTFLKHNRIPDKFLCVANTHVLFNPRRGDVKLLQVS